MSEDQGKLRLEAILAADVAGYSRLMGEDERATVATLTEYREVFRDHIEYVKRTADPERLLVFEAKQGWAPICEFLGVPVPDTPFPHVNEGVVIKRLVRAVKVLRWLPLALAILLFAVFTRC